MNIAFLPQKVVESASLLDVPIQYPWPLGNWAHASFLASFICSARRDAPEIIFSSEPTVYRQNRLRCRFRNGGRKYRERTGPMIATLIHLFRHKGVPLSDIKSFLLHALLLLVKFRRSAAARMCQTSYGQEIWVLVAVMIATRTLVGFQLEIWDTAIWTRSKDSSRQRVEVGDLASWIWPIHTLRSYEACFLGAIGPGVYISQQEFENSELSLRALSFFEQCAFDEHLPRWIWETPDIPKGSVSKLMQQNCRDTVRDTDEEYNAQTESDVNVEVDNLTRDQVQRETQRPRRDSTKSSSTWSVEIITGDEGATWRPRSPRDSLGCEL